MALDIWFLNVGHGDCAVVQFPSGRTMMVDINNSKALDTETKNELFQTALAEQGVPATEFIKAFDAFRKQGSTDPLEKAFSLFGADLTKAQRLMASYEDLLVDPVDFWLGEFGKYTPIFRFVATHPDMDHLTGLHRLVDQERISITNLWDTANTRRCDGSDFGDECSYDFRDWQTYQRLRDPQLEDPKTLNLYQGAQGSYYSDDHIEVLAPTPDAVDCANESGEWNHLSYVLKVNHGEASVILTGDPTVSVQEELVEVFGSEGLSASVLAAPHHGRDSCYCSAFAKAVSPEVTVVSVGKKPSTDASRKYANYSKKVLSTRFNGSMHVQCFESGDFYVYDSVGKLLYPDSDG